MSYALTRSMARRVEFLEAKRHFKAGGRVLVSEYDDEPFVVVTELTTTHSLETTTWEALAATVREWRSRYPRQRFYVVEEPAAAEPGGYTDRAGIDSRANSALLTVEAIITDYAIPAAVRLVLVAERMAREPILTDGSPAAHTVREQAARYRTFPRVG
jgi:hypothetical protein